MCLSSQLAGEVSRLGARVGSRSSQFAGEGRHPMCTGAIGLPIGIVNGVSSTAEGTPHCDPGWLAGPRHDSTPTHFVGGRTVGRRIASLGPRAHHSRARDTESQRREDQWGLGVAVWTRAFQLRLVGSSLGRQVLFGVVCGGWGTLVPCWGITTDVFALGTAQLVCVVIAWQWDFGAPPRLAWPPR